MTQKTGIPKVPAKVDPALRPFLEKIQELAEIGEGDRGDPLDQKLTYRTLLDLGMIELISRNSRRLFPGRNVVSTTNPNTSITPPAPTGFVATGGFSHIHMIWDKPDLLYTGHSSTIILRNTEDNVANAVQVGETIGFQYADVNVQRYDAFDQLIVYYYWIKFESTSGIQGPVNSPVGTPASLSEDPAYVLDLLSGQITETELYADLNSRIDLIDSPISGLVDRSISLQAQIDDLTAATDIQIFYQPTEPTGSIAEGSRWYDTDDDNHPHNYVSGSWVSARDNLVLVVQADLTQEVIDRETADSAQVTRLDSLESTVFNPTTGVDANATAAALLDSRVTTVEGDVTAQASDISALESTLFDVSTGVGANASGLSALDARVTTAEGEITSQASDITSLQADVAALDAEGSAAAISALDARVTTNEGDISSQASSLTLLQTDVDDNTSTLAVYGTSIDGLEASYTVKIDVNGNVAGYGLASTTNTYNGAIHSTMLFSVDTFAIASPGATTMSFVVDGGRVVMPGALIQDATINSAQVGEIIVDKISGISSSFLLANIGIGNIGRAYITDTLQSDNYVSGTSGCLIDFALGYIEINDGYFRGDIYSENAYVRGDVEATSIEAGSANIINTLMVQGQAITAMAGVTNTSTREITSNTLDNVDYLITSKVIDVSGANSDSAVHMSMTAWMLSRIDGNPGDPGDFNWRFKIKRDGVTLFTSPVKNEIAGSTLGSSPVYFDFGFTWVDSNLGGLSGNHTYAVYIMFSSQSNDMGSTDSLYDSFSLNLGKR